MLSHKSKQINRTAISTIRTSKVLTSACTTQIIGSVESPKKVFRDDYEVSEDENWERLESQTAIFKFIAKYSKLQLNSNILTDSLVQNKKRKVSNFLDVNFENDEEPHHRLAGLLERSSAKKKLNIDLTKMDFKLKPNLL